jgi:hypothetical protein
MRATQGVLVRWVRSENDVDALRREVLRNGGEVHGPPETFAPPPEELDDYRDANFEPLTVLATTVSVTFVIKTLSRLWLEHKYTGGLIVDSRSGQLEIRPSRNLDRGDVFILTDSGVQRFGSDQKNDALEALQRVLDRKPDG